MGPYKNKPCYLCKDRLTGERAISCQSFCSDFLQIKQQKDAKLEQERKDNEMKSASYELKQNRYKSAMNIFRLK